MVKGLLQNKNVFLMDIPQAYLPELLPLVTQGLPPYQVVFAFTMTLEKMQETIVHADRMLMPNGVLYIAYPKLKNKLGIAGIHRDAIFPFLGVDDASGYVKNLTMRFNRMLAYDENFTLLGLKKDVTL